MDMANFITRLKEKDSQQAATSKRVKIIYWVLSPVYLILVIRHIFDGSLASDIIGSICFFLSIVLMGIIFTRLHKQFNDVDYSLPTLLMLKQAAQRYKPFNSKFVWSMLAFLLMDAGLCLNTSLSFSFVNVQIYFLGASIVALIIGYCVWKLKYKALLNNALALISELEHNT